MNSKRIKAITNHSICMKCLEKEATHKYSICGRGYGSSFDNCNTHFQLCDDCHDKKYYLWADEISNNLTDEDGNWYGEEYKYEKDILEFVGLLQLESQELFWNKFAYGACADCGMNAQDWIDYELGELPHEKCKEYGMYSPQEIQAYKDRFPNCNKIFLKVYNDGSCACRCPYGASGDKDGGYGLNISNECYLCSHFEEKDDAFKMATVKETEEFYKREEKRLKEMITYAKAKLKLLKSGNLDDEI